MSAPSVPRCSAHSHVVDSATVTGVPEVKTVGLDQCIRCCRLVPGEILGWGKRFDVGDPVQSPHAMKTFPLATYAVRSEVRPENKPLTLGVQVALWLATRVGLTPGFQVPGIGTDPAKQPAAALVTLFESVATLKSTWPLIPLSLCLPLMSQPEEVCPTPCCFTLACHSMDSLVARSFPHYERGAGKYLSRFVCLMPRRGKQPGALYGRGVLPASGIRP